MACGRLTRPWEDQLATKRAETDEFGKSLYRGAEDSDRQIIDQVGKISEARSIPRAQVALAWILSKSVVTSPIIGASKPHHLEDAVAALEVHLTPEEISSLEEPYIPHAISGFL